MNPSVQPAKNAYQNFCAEMRVRYAARPRMRTQKKLGAMWRLLMQPQKASYRPGAVVAPVVAPVTVSPEEERVYYARERRIATLTELRDTTDKELEQLKKWNEAFRQEVCRRVATVASAPA